ncbi:cytidylyltransferase domain-containing protein [Candidatus Bipolaricaulota bacterium]
MKTSILITARLKSTRLPKKVLKPILGRPMLEHLVERLRKAERPDSIILCTSPVAEDDPLAEWAERLDIGLYRGDPDDVLLRLTRAAQEFGADIVVSCTADNPFVDPEYIDCLVDFHLSGGYDYSRSEGLPFGTFSYGLTRHAMERACKIKAAKDTEVWGGYFTETGEFACGILRITDPAVAWPELRLTVDTPEDFELVTRIFEELSSDGGIFSLREIVGLCRRRPDLLRINQHVVQRAPEPIVLKEAAGQADECR